MLFVRREHGLQNTAAGLTTSGSKRLFWAPLEEGEQCPVTVFAKLGQVCSGQRLQTGGLHALLGEKMGLHGPIQCLRQLESVANI